MGSLRWWTEALLRGMEEFACDPTSNSRCPDDGNYCPSCLIFGATGRRRLFRLEINGGERISFRRINIKPSNRSRGWFFGPGVVGNLELKMISLDGKLDEVLVLTPLIIASKWGGIGAKTQLGYGVVEVTNPPDISFENFKKVLENLSQKGKRQRSNEPGFPDLREMFFAKVQFEVGNNEWWKEVDGIKKREVKGDNKEKKYNGYVNDPRMQAWIKSNSVPISPAIKNWLRYGDGKKLWQTGDQNKDKGIENWLFGTMGNDKSASKINISCAYHIKNNLWEFRIWGWIPKSNNPQGFDRDRFLENLKSGLNGSNELKIPWEELFGNRTGNYKLEVWREYDTGRDTIEPDESNFSKFIQSLLTD